MASAVDICNLALGYIGDSATVASIDPPEQSIQAQQCARFYPICRDTLLEMGSWDFATFRMLLAPVDNPWKMWAFAYECPSDMLNAIAVLSNESMSDYTQTWGERCPVGFPVLDAWFPLNDAVAYAPKPFAIEVNAAGQQVILTNVPCAVLRYTRSITETGRFSPLFVKALSRMLASDLAGPIIKGDAGAAESRNQYSFFKVALADALTSDANSRKINPQSAAPWIAGR